MAAAIYSIVLVCKFYINIRKKLVLKKLLLDAIRNDDVQTLRFLLRTNPEVLDLAVKNWPENPIILACKLRNFRVVEEIRIRKPELARLKDDRNGCSLLHLACIRGDVEMVRVLVGLDSQLCFVQARFSMIPLHTAVIHGRLDVIRDLLFARPESLGALTSLHETVFHLAAKNHQSNAFMLLLEEAMPDRKYLLYQVDYQGDSAFDIAVSNKLFLIDRNSVDVSSKALGVSLECEDDGENITRGQTGEPQTNFHYEGVGREEYSNILFDSEDDGLLEDIALNEVQRFRNRIRGSSSQRWVLEKKKFVLIFPAILIGLGFGITVILPYFFPREKSKPNQVVFQFRDVVSRELPPIFYIITLITIVLTTSWINLTMLLFSLPYGSYLFLCGISTLVLYVLLTYWIMPKFFVRIGSNDVSSFQIMWTLALGLVFLGAIIFLLVKYCFHKPILQMIIRLKLVLSILCTRLNRTNQRRIYYIG